MTKHRNKPVIEAIINTAAIALTAYGVTQVTSGVGLQGYVAIAFGIGLEVLKYWGRNQAIW